MHFYYHMCIESNTISWYAELNLYIKSFYYISRSQIASSKEYSYTLKLKSKLPTLRQLLSAGPFLERTGSLMLQHRSSDGLLQK